MLDMPDDVLLLATDEGLSKADLPPPVDSVPHGDLGELVLGPADVPQMQVRLTDTIRLLLITVTKSIGV